MTTLRKLSPEAHLFFLTKCQFQLDKDISIEQSWTGQPFTPLMMALEADEKAIFQELLDYGADVNVATYHYHSVFMLAILFGRSWALDILLDHADEYKLKFNYHSDIPSDNWTMYKKGNTPLILALKAAFNQYDWTESEDEFAIYKHVLIKMLQQPELDTNFHRKKLYPFNFLCRQAGYILDSCPYRMDFFFAVMQEFIDRGADVNFKDNNGGTAITRLLDASEVTDIEPQSEEYQNGIIAGLQILFNQATDIDLTVSANPLKMAFIKPRIMNVMLAEIRAQAIKRICLMRFNPQNQDSNQMKMEEFFHEQFIKKLVGHDPLNPEVSSQAALDDDDIADFREQAFELLDAQVTAFIKQLFKPGEKRLKDIICSEGLQKKLDKAGFDLEQFCHKIPEKKSILEFAAKNGYKEIIWTTALLPDFKEAFDHKSLRKCLEIAIEHNRPACADALLTFMPDKTLVEAMKMAAQHRKLGIMRYVLEKYKSLRAQRVQNKVALDFDIIEPNIQFSVFSEAMKVKNNHWLIDLLVEELRHLFLKRAYTHTSSPGVKEPNLPIETRFENFIVQYIGKHQREHAEYLFKRIVHPILDHHNKLKSMTKALKFYESREVEVTENKEGFQVRRTLNIKPLSAGVISHIYSFLKGPYRTEYHSDYSTVRLNAAQAASKIEPNANKKRQRQR